MGKRLEDYFDESHIAIVQVIKGEISLQEGHDKINALKKKYKITDNDLKILGHQMAQRNKH